MNFFAELATPTGKLKNDFAPDSSPAPTFSDGKYFLLLQKE